MTIPRRSMHGDWSSPLVPALALLGVSIGFASLSRSPVLLAEQGSGFLLGYGVGLLLLGLPLLSLELIAGRVTRQSPVAAFRSLASLHGHSRHWQWLGRGMVLAALLAVAGLAVIAAWSTGFVFRMLAAGGEPLEGPLLSRALSDLVNEPERSLGWLTLFLLAVALPVAAGRRALEGFLLVAVPAGLLLLLALATMVLLRAGTGPIALLAVATNGPMTWSALFAGAQQAFFAAAVATGVGITLGCGLKPGDRVVRLALVVLLLHAVLVLLAAVMVLSLLGVSGARGLGGIDILFQAIPPMLASLPMAALLSSLFAVLVLLFLLTSGVVLLQVPVASLQRGPFDLQRATVLSVGAAWLLAVVILLGYSLWADWRPWEVLPGLSGLSLPDLLNRFLGLILLPLLALGTALYCCWWLPRDTLSTGMTGAPLRFGVHAAIRVSLPLALLLLFASGLGLAWHTL